MGHTWDNLVSQNQKFEGFPENVGRPIPNPNNSRVICPLSL